MKVLIDYPLTQTAEKILQENSIDYVLLPQGDKRSLLEKSREVDAGLRGEIDVVIGDVLRMGDVFYDLFPALRWVQNFSAGIGGQLKPDWDAIERRNLTISTSKIQSQSVSELALAMMLAHYKKLPAFHRRKDARVYADPPAMEMLYDKTALVIGTGNIGSEIGRKLKIAFHMPVIGMNEDGRTSEWFDRIEHISLLEEWLPKVDCVILACPYTQSTHHLMNAERIALMKEDALLVNIARGQLVDQKALVEALKNKRIGGAVLDVFEEEPLKPDEEIWDLENVIITPHLAGVFPSYSEAMIRSFLQNVPYYLQGKDAQMPTYANDRRY